MPTFADFIAPFDPVEFKRHVQDRQPLHIPASGRSFPNPLPWSRFNELLDREAFWDEDTLKVFYQNRPALRENYCRVDDAQAGTKAAADPRKIKALLGFGASLVANQLQRVSGEIAALVHMLQREFAAAAGANAYCSFQGVQAFNTHYDLHDVFALQVEGEKRWRVYEGRADNPLTSLPPGNEAEQWLIATRGRVIQEIVMRPGDLLYLPRGQYHDAITGACASLHLTLWVKPATGVSLFKLLEKAALADSAFRAYLPGEDDPAALQAHLQQLAQRLNGMLTAPAFAIDVRNHQRSLATAPPGFALPARQRPRYYSTAQRAQVTRDREGFRVHLGSAQIDVGATYPAVAWLLQQRLFSFDDLMARFPFVEETELGRVLDRLAAAGAIVETEMR
jgi:hypothetical protein